jgi:hypothetical protein
MFILYSRKNLRIADDVRRRLEAVGIHFWIAPRHIPPSPSYGAQITEGIKDCTTILRLSTVATIAAGDRRLRFEITAGLKGVSPVARKDRHEPVDRYLYC